MRLDVRFMQRAGMNDGLDVIFAHRAAHAIAIGDRADDLRHRGGNGIKADDAMTVAPKARRQSLAEPAGGAGEEDAHGAMANISIAGERRDKDLSPKMLVRALQTDSDRVCYSIQRGVSALLDHNYRPDAWAHRLRAPRRWRYRRRSGRRHRRRPLPLLRGKCLRRPRRPRLRYRRRRPRRLSRRRRRPLPARPVRRRPAPAASSSSSSSSFAAARWARAATPWKMVPHLGQTIGSLFRSKNLAPQFWHWRFVPSSIFATSVKSLLWVSAFGRSG